MSDFKDIIKNKYSEQHFAGNGALQRISSKGIEGFTQMGIPTVKHEEWKYTRIGSVLNKDFSYATGSIDITAKEVDAFRLPGHENANELVFVNGIYQPQLSTIRSAADELIIMTLSEAVNGEFKPIIDRHLGHSFQYHKDGINALSNAFAHQGLLVAIPKNKILKQPLYCYYINDARTLHILAQPRLLMHVAANAQVSIVEEAVTIGGVDCFTNKVAELVVEDNAQVEFYKIQNEDTHSNRVVTTHIRQVGVSKVNSVTITLNGGMIRNNLNLVMEAAGCESHLYGLYCVKGSTHIDNHTVVDNVMPNCLSNELYKGIIDETATAVFNGKIFVRKDAQKTNAYQSNKNILLSNGAGVNTKPQLEIFADDVKCSHGCTIGKLDEDALFYLRARGIGEQVAKSLLLHAFALEILDKITLIPIRKYVDRIISERLDFEV